MANKPRWVIVVVWKEGDSEYVALGTRTAFFETEAGARRVADGFAEGLTGHASIGPVRLSDAEAERIVSLEQTFAPSFDPRPDGPFQSGDGYGGEKM